MTKAEITEGMRIAIEGDRIGAPRRTGGAALFVEIIEITWIQFGEIGVIKQIAVGGILNDAQVVDTNGSLGIFPGALVCRIAHAGKHTDDHDHNHDLNQSESQLLLTHQFCIFKISDKKSMVFCSRFLIPDAYAAGIR